MYYAKDLATGKWWVGGCFGSSYFAYATIVQNADKKLVENMAKDVSFFVWGNDLEVCVFLEDDDFVVKTKHSRWPSIFEEAAFSQLSDALKYANSVAKHKKIPLVSIHPDIVSGYYK